MKKGNCWHGAKTNQLGQQRLGKRVIGDRNLLKTPYLDLEDTPKPINRGWGNWCQTGSLIEHYPLWALLIVITSGRAHISLHIGTSSQAIDLQLLKAPKGDAWTSPSSSLSSSASLPVSKMLTSGELVHGDHGWAWLLPSQLQHREQVQRHRAHVRQSTHLQFKFDEI